MTATTEAVWSEEGTTPDAIEAALRGLVKQLHAENGGFAPARALNMIAFVESRFAGEISNRLSGVGRYRASRTILLSYDAGRTSLDARAIVSSQGEPAEGELGLLRETVLVEIGKRHLDDLLTIADPLVVSDLETLLWSPHGHPEAVDSLLGLAQAVLIDSVDEPSFREAIRRSCELHRRAYVVDLAWLRSTPWRERLATAFDPPAMRSELGRIETVAVRHHPDSTVAAMLFAGWLASRLGWDVKQLSANGGVLSGTATTPGTATTSGTAGNATTGATGAGAKTIAIRLEQAPEQQVRGLESVVIATASGGRLGLRRAEGGLRARSRDSDGREREWTILGASRGEKGILGEGIRQALLRDPTYVPALEAVETMAP
jgi:glucose-6-phosphate dehydrogenase assembly protein OpcA